MKHEAQPNYKAGYRTSEFYLVLASLIVGFLLITYAIHEGAETVAALTAPLTPLMGLAGYYCKRRSHEKGKTNE